MDTLEADRKRLKADDIVDVVEPDALQQLAEQMKKKGATIFNPDKLKKLGDSLPKDTPFADVVPIIKGTDAIKAQK